MYIIYFGYYLNDNLRDCWLYQYMLYFRFLEFVNIWTVPFRIERYEEKKNIHDRSMIAILRIVVVIISFIVPENAGVLDLINNII